jgi:O-antigen ligase
LPSLGSQHRLERATVLPLSRATEVPREKLQKPSISGRIAAAILYAALAGPPFLFGSRDLTTIAIWCALLGLGLMLASTKRLQTGHLLILAGIGVIVLCFGFVLHEQLSDHPWIAPFNPIWATASEVLGRQLTPSASIIRGEPLFALGHPLANVLALVLGLIVGVNSDRARYGLRVMAWAGVVYAIYGMLALAFGPNSILWHEKTAYIGSLTATFVNRNTAAAYFGSCSAVWLVLLMSAIRRSLPRGAIEWAKVPSRLLHAARKDLLLRLVMLFVCLSAMFMTGSRGAVLISLAALTVAFTIYFARLVSRGVVLAAAVAACAGTGLFLLEVLGGDVTDRIDLQGLNDAGRLSAYHSTIRIIADNPWFGTGLGTFAAAFPAYRGSDISMQGLWGIGHSTPLELASEMGIPLALLVAAGWMTALVILFLGAGNQRSRMTVPLSALAVSLIALVHSCIDFSLQIAGYSIVVFALLGLGLSQAISPHNRSARAASAPELARAEAAEIYGGRRPR